MIDVRIDTARFKAALTELQDRLGNLSPVLKAIGEDLAKYTKQRFVAGIGPDGVPWAPNKPATLAQYTHRVKGTITKVLDGAWRVGVKGLPPAVRRTTMLPSNRPTVQPSNRPTVQPSNRP